MIIPGVPGMLMPIRKSSPTCWTISYQTAGRRLHSRWGSLHWMGRDDPVVAGHGLGKRRQEFHLRREQGLADRRIPDQIHELGSQSVEVR
jgi:hypothetical protein